MAINPYLNLIISLFPQGPLWEKLLEEGEFIETLKLVSKAFSTIDEKAKLIFSALDPFHHSIATSHLQAWELLLGIDRPEDQDLDPRRKKVIQRIRGRYTQSLRDLELLLQASGYDASLSECRPFQVGFSTLGEPLFSEKWNHAFQVYSKSGFLTRFQIGSSVGQPLANHHNHELMDFIDEIKPAHTIAIYPQLQKGLRT